MSWIKNLSVLVCLIGVAFIAFGTNKESDNEQQNTWYGIVECLISTFALGITEVCVKIFGDKYFSQSTQSIQANKKDIINSKIFLQALIGICCLCTMWIGIIILHLLGIETFELPKTKQDILIIGVPAIMDTIYAAAFIIGICVMNPVFIAVFQLLVIPITFIYDITFNGLSITTMSVCGALFIFVGFLLMELPITKYFKTCK